METSTILSADILDILFDGRNKAYGAYDLRKTYNRRIRNALIGTFLLCAWLLAFSIIANSAGKRKSELAVQDVTLENMQPEEKKPEPVQPPPPKTDPPKVEMTTFTPPKIVKNEEVKPDEEIKEVEKLEETKIGSINRDGVKDDGVIASPIENGTYVAAPKVEKDVDKIFTDVQIPAQFNGGLEAWRKYLERTLNSGLPAENGANSGSYTVIVSFIVDRTGIISDVRAENDPGYGTKAEAIRVIQKGPHWKPAIQNGEKVIYRHKQSITFRVEEQ